MRRRACSPGVLELSREDVAERAASATVVDDIVLPFAVEALSTRGRLVRLGPAIDQLLKRHDYPEPVSKLVGGGGDARGASRLDPEARGPLPAADEERRARSPCCSSISTRPSNLRALWRGSTGTRLAAAGAKDLLGRGHMAFTIDPGGDMTRYQGVIALEGQGLEGRRASLFRALGADPDAGAARGRRDGRRPRPRLAGRRPHRPVSAGLPTRRRADFHPGDAPEGTEPHQVEEDDAWTEAQALAATTEAHELIDPTLSGERLLFACSTSAACGCSSRRRSRPSAAAPPKASTRCCAASRRRRSGTWSATTA